MPYDPCAITTRLVMPDASVADLLIDMGGTDGLFLVDLDLGYPSPRVDAEDLTDDDGTDDGTLYHGASLVSVRAAAVATDTATKQAVIDRLGAFMRPGVRPFLHYTLEDGGDERRVALRAQNRSAPLTSPWMHVMQDVLAAWVNPRGVQESADEITVEVPASSSGAEAGIVFPVVFPLAWPYAPGSGSTLATNDGNASAMPVIRMYGSATNPRLENITTGQTLEFGSATVGDLVLAAGEYVELDVRARTVTLDGDAADSRYQYLNFADSEWWSLAPGVNELRYYPEAFDPGATSYVIYHHTWI